MLRILCLLWLLSSVCLAQPIGKKVPEFTFKTLSGEKVTLKDLQAKSPSGVVMLTFWCTTCNSCRASESTIKSLAEQYADKAKVVAISASRQDSPDSVSKYLDKHKLKMPVLLDSQSDLARHFNAKRTTTTLVIDKDGRLRYHGALMRKRKLFAKSALDSVLQKKIVGRPVGPTYG